MTDVGIVSHLIACLGFGGQAIWLLYRRDRDIASLLLAAVCMVMAAWAGIVALAVRHGGVYLDLVSPAETLRTGAWLAFLIFLLSRTWRLDQRRSSLFAVAAVFGFILTLQLGIDLLAGRVMPTASGGEAPFVTYLFVMTRLTAAIGGVVLVHNLYVNAAPSNQWSMRLLCIGLAALFGYDLNLYTLNLLFGAASIDLFAVRGAVDALVVPLIAWSARRNRRGWKLQVSRQVVFHTLSLGAVGGYLIVMSIVAYGLRLVGGDWGRLLQISFLFAMMILAAVVVWSGRTRAWLRVQINKHFFAYKYDYRQEWLRFIDTISRTEAAYGDLSQRVIQGICDIVDSPGGALYVPSTDSGFELAARWNYRTAASSKVATDGALAHFLGSRGRIIDLDELRAGEGDYGDLSVPLLAADDHAWLIVPLLHLERLAGFVVIERSRAERELNWEDYDVLRTVGRQAASYIAEQSSQVALSEAQKFDEFNRRFAFIMHDIKNLVSQLSLVARNAERHADNMEFRADMIKTLQSSVGKMNDLLARLAQHSSGKGEDFASVDVAEAVGAVVAAKRQSYPLLTMAGADQRLVVAADPARLEQVFAHLVQNAIDASPADAPIEIVLKREGDRARIDIIDHGSGMSASFVRNDLFKPFHSTKAGGFGIGAYEARETIQSFGGRLDVVSREGEGTLFSVILPVAVNMEAKRSMA